MDWALHVDEPLFLLAEVPSGTRALCGVESSSGWQWARGQDVTCERCRREHLEAELERDSIVRCMRKYGYEGPITREAYIGMNWAGRSIRPWTAEHEDSLPLALQDWPRFYKLAKRRSRRRNKRA